MKPNKNFPDPQEQCSATFITCNGGQTLIRKCIGVLRYDRERDLCDYPNFIHECGGTPTEPTTSAQPVTQAEPSGNGFDCSGNLPGNYANPSEECSSVFESFLWSINHQNESFFEILFRFLDLFRMQWRS